MIDFIGRKARLFIALTMSLATLTKLAFAETRTWTDSTGKHKIEAEFVEILEGQVKLKKPDGKIASLPLGKLSKDDQIYLRKLVKERREAGATEAAAPANPVLGRGRVGTEAVTRLMRGAVAIAAFARPGFPAVTSIRGKNLAAGAN